MQSILSIRADFHLWIGLAILGWCSALAIHKQLKIIRDVSEVIERAPSPSTRVSKQTQEAIKTSSLSLLLQSPNSEIRDASIRIIAERALQSPTVWRLLRRHVRNTTHPDARNQALGVLAYFGPGSVHEHRMRQIGSGAIEHEEFFHPATFNAVIACLCSMLPAAQEAETLGQHHESAEADALWVTHKLFNQNSDLALKAGLVSKWLTNYPLNLRDPNKTKQDVIRDMMEDFDCADDYERLLCCVIQDLAKNAEGRKQMAQYNLGDPVCSNAVPRFPIGNYRGVRQRHYNPGDLGGRIEVSESDRNIGEVQDVAGAMMNLSRIMAGNYQAAAHNGVAIPRANHNYSTQSRLGDFEGPTPFALDDELNLRAREGNVEERALRNRRREAMVFAEAGRPMRREDIIESQRETHPEEVMEEEIEQMIEDEETSVSVSQATRRQQMTWAELLARLRPDGSIRI